MNMVNIMLKISMLTILLLMLTLAFNAKQARGEHANSTQKGSSRPVGSNPEPSCCEATVLATVPPLRTLID